jgi:hypothetical protein
MELPEKLYFGESDKGILEIYSARESDNEVEYIRKDVFIEEVCKYLQENCTYTHPRKGTSTCAVNLTLLKEYLEDKV